MDAQKQKTQNQQEDTGKDGPQKQSTPQQKQPVKNFNKFKEQKILKYILLGKTGHGKSSFVNTLLKNKSAPIGHNLKPQTTQVNRYEGSDNVFGQKFVIFDTPGLDGRDENILQITQDIGKILQKEEQIHGIIYVVDMTQTRDQTIDYFLNVFRIYMGLENINQWLIPILTHFDSTINSQSQTNLWTHNIKTREEYFREYLGIQKEAHLFWNNNIEWINDNPFLSVTDLINELQDNQVHNLIQKTRGIQIKCKQLNQTLRRQLKKIIKQFKINEHTEFQTDQIEIKFSLNQSNNQSGNNQNKVVCQSLKDAGTLSLTTAILGVRFVGGLAIGGVIGGPVIALASLMLFFIPLPFKDKLLTERHFKEAVMDELIKELITDQIKSSFKKKLQSEKIIKTKKLFFVMTVSEKHVINLKIPRFKSPLFLISQPNVKRKKIPQKETHIKKISEKCTNKFDFYECMCSQSSDSVDLKVTYKIRRPSNKELSNYIKKQFQLH